MPKIASPGKRLKMLIAWCSVPSKRTLEVMRRWHLIRRFVQVLKAEDWKHYF